MLTTDISLHTHLRNSTAFSRRNTFVEDQIAQVYKNIIQYDQKVHALDVLKPLMLTWSGGRTLQLRPWHRACNSYDWPGELNIAFYLAKDDTLKDFDKVLEAIESLNFGMPLLVDRTLDAPLHQQRNFMYLFEGSDAIAITFTAHLDHASACTIEGTGEFVEQMRLVCK